MFAGGKCTIKGPDGAWVGAVPKNSNGLYKVAHERDEVNAATEVLTLDQFHRRMDHISPEVARKLVDKGFVTGVRLETTPTGDSFFCESCVYAKATRKPVAKAREGERATEFGGEIHSDLLGPAPVATKAGKRYYVTFTDDKTRLTYLNLLRKKEEAFDSYKEYEAWCDTHLDARNLLFTTHPSIMAWLNAVTESSSERIRALLHSSGLPKMMWGEAARHVVWLMNRTSTKAVDGMTPYEAAFGKKPDLRHVREWGEKVWVRIEGGDKLGGRVKEGRWLGIDECSKGFRIYWLDKRL